MLRKEIVSNRSANIRPQGYFISMKAQQKEGMLVHG
jgi:hypothetical protein